MATGLAEGYTQFMRIVSVCLAVTLAGVCLQLGCSKRQVLPGVVAATGAVGFGSGVVYRATLDADSLLGDTAAEKAAVSTLVFAGTALVITGIVLAVTTPICEVNSDCWYGDVCEKKSHTCVPAPSQLSR